VSRVADETQSISNLTGWLARLWPFSSISTLLNQEVLGMSLLCLFGRHKPLLHSVTKSHRGYRALCDHCARPLERELNGQWEASEPLDIAARQAA
jgi:hypothetical protein